MKIEKEIVGNEIIARTVTKDPGDSTFHWHETFEIVEVLGESGHFLVDGKHIEAKIGDLIVIKDQSVHRFMLEKETLVRIIQFKFKILFDADTPVKSIKPHITSEEIEKIPQMRDTLNLIFDAMQKQGNAEKVSDKPVLKHLAIALYMLLMENFRVEENDAESKKDRKEFFRITEYIADHFKEGINATIIGQRLFISRSYATKLFMKYSGMGLNDYIRLLRVKHANQLMMEGYSITEAALESGFQCVRTFNNAYRACMGITPSDYVKDLLNQKRSKA